MSAQTMILFLLAFIIHNAEESIWLVRAAGRPAKIRLHAAPTQDQFLLAVLFITSLAILVAALALFFPGQPIFTYAFFGYVGAMVLNVIGVHLLQTLIDRRYSPGLMTGLLALLPVGSLLIEKGLRVHLITVAGLLAATVVMAALLLAAIVLMFRVADKWIVY
ncbi:MAG: HXXEE domain-containing protein [Sporolactobacillus sp.]|nr:HXXEE domain-containing protein [Sporolactobacillus sp.]